MADTGKIIALANGLLSGVKREIEQRADEVIDTISGQVAYIPDGAGNAPVESLKISIIPTQSGSGIPSPTNIRAITGYTGATFNQSDEDVDNPTSTQISWQSQAGTVYYGQMDMLSGVLTVTHKGYVLAFADMNNSEDYPGWKGVSGLRDCYVGVNGGATITLSNMFPPEKNTSNVRINTNGTNNIVFIPKSVLNVSNQTEAKTTFAGKSFVMISPLVTPVTYNLTALTNVKTVLGENSFWTNVGVTEVKYHCNTKGYVDKKAERTINPKDTSFFESINFFDPETATFVNCAYVNASGVITTSNSTFSVIVPVKPNTTYWFYIPNINRGYVATGLTDQFDVGETYTLIKGINVSNEAFSFTTGGSAKYAFVYFYSGSGYDYETNKTGAALNIGEYTGTHSPSVGNEYLPDGVANVLKGTEILIFGDSITDSCNITVNDSKETTAYSWRNPSNSYTNAQSQTVNFSMWPKIIKESMPVKEIRNYALSGAEYKTATRTSGEERKNLQYQIDVALNDLNNPHSVFSVANFVPDIVIFALGTNDGDPSDTYSSVMNDTVFSGNTIDVDGTIAALDDSKTIGSARKAFMRIKKAFPMAQIYVVLPIQTANSDTNLGNLHTYLEQMAQRYGCIIIDGTYESGITRDFNVPSDLGVYLKDGLHPNEKGQNLMARMIISSIKSHYMPFGYGFNT